MLPTREETGKEERGVGAVKGTSWRHGQEPEGKREAGTGERGQRTLKGLTLYDCDVSLSCPPLKSPVNSTLLTELWGVKSKRAPRFLSEMPCATEMHQRTQQPGDRGGCASGERTLGSHLKCRWQRQPGCSQLPLADVFYKECVSAEKPGKGQILPSAASFFL